jgi:hypothetical protein
LPVFSDSSLPPLPRSSVPAWTTTVRWGALATGILPRFGGSAGGKAYANDALGADELDELVAHGALGVALGVGLDVAQVANVTVLIRGRAVRLAVGVDCQRVLASIRAADTQGSQGKELGVRTVWPSRRAAVGVVAEGVDVHATLGVGVVARDIPGHDGRGRLGLLLEGDSARDLRVTPDDSD